MDFAYDAAISYDFRVRILCPKAPNRTRSTQLIVMGSLPSLLQPFGVPTRPDRNHAIVALRRPRVLSPLNIYGGMDGRTRTDGRRPQNLVVRGFYDASDPPPIYLLSLSLVPPFRIRKSSTRLMYYAPSSVTDAEVRKSGM